MRTRLMHYLRSLRTSVVALLSVSLVACSDYTSDADDWDAFEHFAKQDRKGERINCGALIDTRVKKRLGREQWTDNLIDYLYQSDYSFSQCEREIDEFVHAFCERRTRSAVDRATSGGGVVGQVYRDVCDAQFRSALSEISYRYMLPEVEGGILRLEDNGVILAPSSVRNIEFGQTIRDALWYIAIVTDDRKHWLYYGNSAQWETAKSELATVLSHRHCSRSVELSKPFMAAAERTLPEETFTKIEARAAEMLQSE
ncbi:hypothetical protein [Marinimicrobium sp. ABcell2]|uniref:hypothetical protein n=1 Tax=Marinimicrobium sp. ABcell2 TaxID=3069751 RepID=UPI0027B426CD|nr:hypothetical protein [Marinimicrobium sp. ABcell2]MDQ2078541.1 hypothetical protein [Marinimicrobium sp. ABcell2]